MLRNGFLFDPFNGPDIAELLLGFFLFDMNDIFITSQAGLGYLILVSTSQSKTPLAFGALVILTIMSIILYYGIEFIEQWVVPWAPKN